jgi:hypothetical protein
MRHCGEWCFGSKRDATLHPFTLNAHLRGKNWINWRNVMQTAAAFWIALAAVIIAGAYFRSLREATKHETLRRIVEKTGQVDERQFKALFEPPPSVWLTRRPRAVGRGYRALRILGTVLMFIAAGLALFFTIFAQTGAQHWNAVLVGYAASSLILLIGAGVFFCSRFMPISSIAGSPERPTA